LSHYKTRCPACGNEDADIIYAFWVKSAICTNPECKKQVPLFSDYLVTQKTPSIRFFSDARCPRASCGKTFDWEIEPAAMVGEGRLMLASALDGAGEGRGNRRWTYSHSDASAQCPWCNKSITPKTISSRPQKKKVRISAFYCPHCAAVIQYRGTPPDEIECPGCLKSFLWGKGNVSDQGKFRCPHCGQGDAIIESLRRLPKEQPLPTRMYALEGYCSRCAGIDGLAGEGGEAEQQNFLDETNLTMPRNQSETRTHTSLISKNNGKFFKGIAPPDERCYQEACQKWATEKKNLPYPKQEIPLGYNTNQMMKHNYKFWNQMFNPRQLLCLAILLDAICQEENQILTEMLLSAFVLALNNNNMFSRFHRFTYREGKVEGIFSRHDYQPKATSCEANCWGAESVGYGSFQQSADKIIGGKAFARHPFDWQEKTKRFADPLSGSAQLFSQSSTNNLPIDGQKPTFVITDPPYAGNVNYSELADFFYVWLRLALANTYPEFLPEISPKSDEIIENPTRGKTIADFQKGLTDAFWESNRASTESALLVFTFHHSEEEAWEALLQAICEGGWTVEAVYPVHGESENAMPLLAGTNISYDLIHVCRKRDRHTVREKRAWATIKPEIRREARKEIERIEGGVYGGGKNLTPADKLIVLTGKCLQLYSRHYNAVVDHTGRVVPLKEALEDIRMLVDQLVSLERPLPGELEEIDRPSYVYLTALSEKNEIKSDEVHKATRGIIEVDELLEAGLMKKGRAGRGRTFEVKTPSERFSTLLEKFKDESPVTQNRLFDDQPAPPGNGSSLFIDRLHFLIGLAEGRENLRPWIERWGGEIPQIRAACEYLLDRRKEFAPALKKILTMIDVGSLGFK